MPLHIPKYVGEDPIREQDELYILSDIIDRDRFADTVQIIQKYAFDGCTNLTSVVVPKDMLEIGNDAFLDTAFAKDALEKSEIHIGSDNLLGISS